VWGREKKRGDFSYLFWSYFLKGEGFFLSKAGIDVITLGRSDRFIKAEMINRIARESYRTVLRMKSKISLFLGGVGGGKFWSVSVASGELVSRLSGFRF
jgi:hypothetical protein